MPKRRQKLKAKQSSPDFCIFYTVDAKAKCFSAALRFLANREHSAFELKQKLCAKGWPERVVEQVLLDLSNQNLQSDIRYAQSLIRVRQKKGYGPIFIQNYLREKGIGMQIIESTLDFNDSTWQKALIETAHKKFGTDGPADYTQQAKRMNFLKRRGFCTQQIRDYFDTRIEHIDDYENQ